MLILTQLEDFDKKVRVLGVGGAGIMHELLHKTSDARYVLKEMQIKNKTQMKVLPRPVWTVGADMMVYRFGYCVRVRPRWSTQS
jgi:hypothetical protein